MSDKVEARCKGCNAEIYFVKNANGKAEPFDKKPARVLMVRGDSQPAGQPLQLETEYNFLHGHYSHFVTCPKAAEFRKPR